MKLISENIDTIKSQIKEGIKFYIEECIYNGRGYGNLYSRYHFMLNSENYKHSYTHTIDLDVLDIFDSAKITDAELKVIMLKYRLLAFDTFPFLKEIRVSKVIISEFTNKK